MAPTAKKPAEKPAEKKSDTDVAAPKKKRGKPRNYDLGNGIYRFSRSRMYHKKALYKFVHKKNPPKPKVKKPLFIVKPIGGEKNGGKRIVWLKKRRSYYPTQDKIKKRHSRGCFRKHKRYIRKNLKPGTICILLAGLHKGKRVILLKHLASGLLLVNGPFLINACPLRRISQNYVIGTKTRIDIKDLKLPENMNDKYFRRERKKRSKKVEGDIFSSKKETYKVSDQRKTDQAAIDKQLVKIIKKRPDSNMVFTYLSAMFGLRSSQYPHRMKF